MKKNSRAIPFKHPQLKTNHEKEENTIKRDKPVINYEIRQLSQYNHLKDFLRYSSER